MLRVLKSYAGGVAPPPVLGSRQPIANTIAVAVLTVRRGVIVGIVVVGIGVLVVVTVVTVTVAVTIIRGCFT